MSGTQKRPVADRFAEKCRTLPNGCIEYTGKGNQYGYGEFRAHGKRWSAHRWSFTQANGPIPEGLFICHTCDFRACVNPQHLFLGTQRDNIRDCSAKGRVNKTIKARGQDHGNATLTNEQVREMRRRHEMGMSVKEVASLLGSKYSHAHAMLTRRTYKSVT